MLYVGYSYYIILLFLVTGILILRFDKRGYRMKNMVKEYRVAHWLGWTNFALGLLTLLANWIYQSMLW